VPRRIESHFIPGPAGRLEALLEEPEHLPAPSHAVLVCHPHPRHGGTMHNKVVYRIARAFRRAGAVVLRINFRGVNLSEGVYDNGVGEVEDARAALDWLRQRYPRLPWSLAGFSFGSRVILRLGCQDCPGAQRLVAVGFPTSWAAGFEFLETCPAPKLFVHSTNDQFGPRDQMQQLFDRIAPPKQLIFVPAADHFFADALDTFEQALASAIAR
jgi:uncharacterized protein